jgi:hypothetical protein
MYNIVLWFSQYDSQKIKPPICRPEAAQIRRLEVRLTPLQFAQRSTNEAPRGEGRRGANERLWLRAGAAPVATLTGATPICSATQVLDSRRSACSAGFGKVGREGVRLISLLGQRLEVTPVRRRCIPSATLVPSKAPDDTGVGGLQAASSRIGLHLSTDWVAAARAEIPVFAPRLPKEGDWSQRSRRPYQPGGLAAKT